MTDEAVRTKSLECGWISFNSVWQNQLCIWFTNVVLIY